MKEMNEYKAEVFSRMEKGIKERKRKRNRLIAYATTVCLCLVMLISFSIWQSGLLTQPIDNTGNNNNSEFVEGAINDGDKDGAMVDGNADIDGDPNGYWWPDKDGKTNEENSNTSADAETDKKSEENNISDSKDLDLRGMIVYNGRTYEQNEKLSADNFVLDKKIGTGNDFDGTYNIRYLKKIYAASGYEYRDENFIESEVYTVKNNTDLLCVVLENGGKVLLQAETSAYDGTK